MAKKGRNRVDMEDGIDQSSEEEPKTAKGKALFRSEADMESLSVVTTRDIQDARKDWKANTLEGYEGLIDATEVLEDEE